MILGSLFIVSALVRLFDGVPQVLAANDALSAATTKPAQSALEDITAPDRDLQRVLDALRERERKLAAAEQDLAARQQELAEQEKQALARLTEAERAEAALQETMALADQASETDLARLTQVYERMKPKSAAALFEAMQPAFSAGFLGRMSPDAAAAILASMSPEAAYSVSAILAGRNAEAGVLQP